MFYLLLVLMGSIAQDTRLTEKTHKVIKVKLKRDTSVKWERIIQNLNNLNYGGEIDTGAQDGEWFATTKGEMLQYSTPKRNEPVKLEEAVKLCTTADSKLWDEKPQLASGLSNIRPNENYWISDINGAMAQYTEAETTPEVVYDDICQQVKVTPTGEDDQPLKIVVETIIDTATNTSQGCITGDFTGLTLCLRPVQNFEHANSKDYRRYQTETKAIINQEAAARRLQEIKTELDRNQYKTSTEETKIPAKLQIITDNVDIIKKEDQEPFPDFNQIKRKWIEIIEQMQDLERISTKIASEHKLKELEEQVDRKFEVNRGQQAENNLAWKAKWNTINQNIENNRNRINNLESNKRNELAGEPAGEVRDTEHEDKEGQNLVNKTMDGYFQTFVQELNMQQQSLQNFCRDWNLDCRVIAMGGMFMIMIGGVCTCLVIYITIQTCNTEKRVKRIREYLDIKDTRREQEEDDQMWIEKIEQGTRVTRPNPTRNRAQMDFDKGKTKEKLNSTAEWAERTN